jgi:biopolymer transport protein ExbD
VNFRRGGRGRDNLELNVTSMIDVLLILLIFFILTTTFSSETRLRVNLPQAAGAPAEQGKNLEIAIDAQGRFFVDQHEVVNTTLDALKRALQNAAGGDKDKTVIISADGKTPHQAVMTALDAASQLGLTRVTFAAESQP